MQSSHESTHHYHPSCHKKYTAVKRSKSASTANDNDVIDTPPAKQLKIQTRNSSVLPKDDEIKGACFFCGMSRKKMKGKEEARQSVRTMGGCESLRQRAELSTNERVKSLMRSGVDLIAAEAWYHGSCRGKFLSETDWAVQKAPMES